MIPGVGQAYDSLSSLAQNAGQVGSDITSYPSNVASAFQSGVSQATQGYQQAKSATNPLQLLEGSASSAAGGLSAAFSPVAPIGKTALDATGVTPQINQATDAISNNPSVQQFASSPAGDVATRAMQDLQNVNTIAGSVAGFEPGVAAATHVATDAPSLIGQTGAKIDSSVTSLLGDKPTPVLRAQATNDINKALSNTGKTTASGLLSKDSNRLAGMETLYAMTKDQPITRSDGTTFTFDPTHITDPHDLLSAFVQAKNALWSKVESGLQKGASIPLDYAPAVKTLQDVIQNSDSASLRAHATARLAELGTLAQKGPQAAQRYLQEELNPRIGAAVTGATDAPNVKLDATLAHNVNGVLDTGLSKVNDASIRPFKTMYANLKSIEPDLVRTVQKTVRLPGGGIPQYLNDFGNIDLLDAIFTHNPALFVARGAAKKFIANRLGIQRDSMDHLSKAFQSIGKYVGSPKPMTDAPVLALPPGTPGAGSSVGSGATINLPATGENNGRTTF